MYKVFIDCYKYTIEMSFKLRPKKKQAVDIYLYIPKELVVKQNEYKADDFYKNKISHFFFHVKTPNVATLSSNILTTINDQNIALMVKTFKVFTRTNLINAELDNIDELIAHADKDLKNLRSKIDISSDFNKKLKIADEVMNFYYEQGLLGFLYSYPEKTELRVKIEKIKSYQHDKYGLKSDFNTAHSLIKRKEEFLSIPIQITGKKSRLGVFREQFAFSLAAFISMLITTIIVFIVQKGQGNLSYSVFITICVSYIFKDRFKELFRNYVIKNINRGQDQFKVSLIDYQKSDVGFVRELVEFCTAPPEIDELRRFGKFLKSNENEDILHHKVSYFMQSERFKSPFSVLRNFFLINIENMLKNAPEQHVTHYSVDSTGDVVKNYLQIRYELNLIIKAGEELSRYRIKISSDGIESFEPVISDNI